MKTNVCQRCGRDWDTVKKFARGMCKSCYNYHHPTKRRQALDDGALQERFWKKVSVLKEDDCWLWQASCTGKGYGQFMMNGKPWMAHRVAWALTHLKEPGKSCVLHSCDTPGCCNPKHLRLGTHKQNSEDMVRKRRHALHKATDYARDATSLLRLVLEESISSGLRAEVLYPWTFRMASTRASFPPGILQAPTILRWWAAYFRRVLRLSSKSWKLSQPSSRAYSASSSRWFFASIFFSAFLTLRLFLTAEPLDIVAIVEEGSWWAWCPITLYLHTRIFIWSTSWGMHTTSAGSTLQITMRLPSPA